MFMLEDKPDARGSAAVVLEHPWMSVGVLLTVIVTNFVATVDVIVFQLIQYQLRFQLMRY